MEYLKKNLKGIKKDYINDDNDYCMIIDGKEGSGKSTLGATCCLAVDPNFSVDKIAFTGTEFLKVMHKAKYGSAVMWDEAEIGAFSRDSVGKINKLIVTALMVSRAKRLFLCIIIPSFFVLDKYLRMHRVGMLIHVIRRGEFAVYPSFKGKLKKLTVDGSKYWDYGVVKPLFIESFGPLDKKTPMWEEYQKRKKKFMKDHLSDTINNITSRTRLEGFLYNIYCKTSLSQIQLAEMMGVSPASVNKYIVGERELRGIDQEEEMRLKKENAVI